MVIYERRNESVEKNGGGRKEKLEREKEKVPVCMSVILFQFGPSISCNIA